MDKVYCRKCCYFLDDDASDLNWCNHPNNIEIVLNQGESYLSPATYKDQNIKHPSEINKHNNCSWFERRIYDDCYSAY